MFNIKRIDAAIKILRDQHESINRKRIIYESCPSEYGLAPVELQNVCNEQCEFCWNRPIGLDILEVKK